MVLHSSRGVGGCCVEVRPFRRFKAVREGQQQLGCISVIAQSSLYRSTQQPGIVRNMNHRLAVLAVPNKRTVHRWPLPDSAQSTLALYRTAHSQYLPCHGQRTVNICPVPDSARVNSWPALDSVHCPGQRTLPQTAYSEYLTCPGQCTVNICPVPDSMELWM